MKIQGKLATIIGLSLIAVGSIALPANASPVSRVTLAPTTKIVDQNSTAASRSCGGPYKVGDDAVWYNCNDKSSERICVRQYVGHNYQVEVDPSSEHHNPWWRTKNMSTDMSDC
jgi:hypothetical protein